MTWGTAMISDIRRQAGLRVRSLVVLVSQLHAALGRLNTALPPEAITAAVDELTRDRSAMSVFPGAGESQNELNPSHELFSQPSPS